MKDFSDFSELNAMKDHPVSGQIDQLFKTVIKEEKKMSKSAAALKENNSPEVNDQELSLDADGEFALDLGGDDSPPQDSPLDEGLDLSLDGDGDLDLAEGSAAEEEVAPDHYGEISLANEEVGLSLGEDDGLSLGEDDGLSLGEDDGLSLGEDDGLSLSEDDGLSLGEDDGLSLGEDDEELSLSEDDEELSLSEDDEELSLGEDDELSLSEETESEGLIENMGELDLSADAPDFSLGEEEEVQDFSLDEDLSSASGDELSLSDEDALDNGLSMKSDIPAADDFGLGDEQPIEDISLSFANDEELSLSSDEADLSPDAQEKLKEIDAIMDLDASRINIHSNLSVKDENLDEPLVSDDLDLDSLNFSSENEEEVVVAPPKEEKTKKKKKEVTETHPARDLGEDLKQISGAYSGEMERMQATISNLRTDREELLLKIQKMEDDKVLQSRQSLTLRAELDEKKIELTIIRKKLNEEINELKDRLKFFDEKKLILEEKNRLLTLELDKAAQRNKMDVKKVQMRERELEQKLELLKSDAETQIKHRDLKILELKRRVDAMEFDMESISQQEKRSVESRYELEDKLDKAIKTLRTAITVLEDESDRSNALSALKKNIEV